jgi:hypothetical protein
MAVHERQNSIVHRTRMKRRGSRVKPEVATVSLARGVFGGDRRTKTETEREQLNAGEFPKTLTPSASVHRYHACPWTQTYNSLYLSLNTFSSRPFLPVLERIFIYDQISQISFSLYNARSFEYFFFLFTNFNYLHRNLTITFFFDYLIWHKMKIYAYNSTIPLYPLQFVRLSLSFNLYHLVKVPPITYDWTGLLILDHSYLVGNLTISKIAETKALEPLKPWHFCISNFRTC